MHDDDSIVNPRADHARSLDQLIERRLSRRQLLRGSAMAGAALSVPWLVGCSAQNGPVVTPVAAQ